MYDWTTIIIINAIAINVINTIIIEIIDIMIWFFNSRQMLVIFIHLFLQIKRVIFKFKFETFYLEVKESRKRLKLL